MLRVLIVSQATPQWLVDQICMALPKNTEVDCITGSKVSNVNIIQAPCYNNKSYFTKLISWFQFTFFLFSWNKNDTQPYDLLIATSNPPFNSFSLIKVKEKRKCPFVFINWDIYPQGVISANSPFPLNIVFKVWSKINNKYYPKIDQIITIGESMKQLINDYLSKPLNIKVIPISVDTNKIQPVLKKCNVFLQQNNINSRWIVLYSGAMGYSKNIELILETAKILEEDTEITFVLIGSGPKYHIAKDYIKKQRLKNVCLFPLQSEDIYPHSISCGDIAILPEQIKKVNTSIPSKCYSMMASGEAIIAVSHRENDLARLIIENEIGEVVDVEDAQVLAKTIVKLLYDEDRLRTYKENARSIAKQKFSLEEVNRKYKSVFDSLIGS